MCEKVFLPGSTRIAGGGFNLQSHRSVARGRFPREETIWESNPIAWKRYQLKRIGNSQNRRRDALARCFQLPRTQNKFWALLVYYSGGFGGAGPGRAENVTRPDFGTTLIASHIFSLASVVLSSRNLLWALGPVCVAHCYGGGPQKVTESVGVYSRASSK